MDWPNGVAVSSDATTLYVAETFGRCVTAFDIAREGDLSGRRVFARLEELTDGLCLDSNGGLWIGLPSTNEFAHVDRDGRVDNRLATQGAMATACVLGGDDRRTLFACSVNSTPETISAGVTAGGLIESAVVATAGAGWP